MGSGDYLNLRLVSFTENEVSELANMSEEEWACSYRQM